MARLPTAQDLGGIPSARSGAPIASYDTSAAAEGARRFGQQVAQIGADLGDRAQKLRAYDTERKLQEFAYSEEKMFAEASRNVAPGAENFAATYADGYKERASAFAKDNLSGVPAEQRAEYDQRLFGVERKLFLNAAETERTEQTRYGKASLDETVDNNLLPRTSSIKGPADLEVIVADANKLIDASPYLTPVEKEVEKEKTRARIELSLLENLPPSERTAWLTGSSVVDKIIGVESGGDPTADNPNSSAYGPGQFISATWMDMVNRYRPDLVGGKSKQDILALRSDSTLSREMTARYAEENTAFLGARGIPATAGNVYLAHFLGPQGAAAVLNSSPDTPLSKLLPAGVISANKEILDGKTAGHVAGWSAKKMAGAKGASSIRSVTYEDRVKLLDQAESDQVALDREEDRVAREGRGEIEKEGIDLLMDNKLTPQWVEQNRDNLSPATYRAFVKEVTPGQTSVTTDPRDYLSLLDMTESDPQEAIAEAREAYAGNRIDRDTFNKIVSTANGKLDGEQTPPHVKQVRQYVSNVSSPPPDGSRAEFARHLDTMFIFDDWSRSNPKATRQEIRTFADDLLQNQKKHVQAFKRSNTPLPQYLRVPSRDVITVDELNKAKARTSLSLQLGGISEAEAATQARLLRDWYDLVGEVPANGR